MRMAEDGRCLIRGLRNSVTACLVVAQVLGSAPAILASGRYRGGSQVDRAQQAVTTGADTRTREDLTAEGLVLVPFAPPPPLDQIESLLPAWALPLLGIEGSVTTMGTFTFTQTSATGSAGSGVVYNGDRVTYTIELCNRGSVDLSDALVIDLLPQASLDRIACGGGCELVSEENFIPEPAGGTIVVTATREISWSLSSLQAHTCATLSYSGRVVGRPDGSALTNYVFAAALSGSTPVHAEGNEALSLIARVKPLERGGASISEVPTWFSQDVGGTISQDWGDFDRDGDMDLVLGSSLGTTVYRNDDGRLERYWVSPQKPDGGHRMSYGVGWADLDGDPKHSLELLVVGDSRERQIDGPGVNYVYSYSDTLDAFAASWVFTSYHQLVRLALGDFDGDGDIDFVGSTNAIDAPDICPVALYRNDGGGQFTGTLEMTGTQPAVSPDVECLSERASAALAAADYDKDGDLDLAVGVFPGTLALLVNDRGTRVITQSNPFSLTDMITVETDLEYLPYDLAWGDFDRDGYLDLAAAYPLQRMVRVYHNQVGRGGVGLAPLTQRLRTGPFMTPLSVDWVDVDGDGWLELVVADSPPRIYAYSPSDGQFVLKDDLHLPPSDGQIWSARAADLNNRGDTDLVLSNRDGPSQLFSAVAPRLKPTITAVTTRKANSVAWGNYDQDVRGTLDLLLGSAELPNVSTVLHINRDGAFETREEFTSSGFGPHVVAFGDVTGDGLLDVAVGTPTRVQVYTNGETRSPAWSLSIPGGVRTLAWGDANDDGKLDLLIGAGDGTVRLYLNEGGALATDEAFTTDVGDVRSVAWGDFDGDHYLDFAVGGHDQPVQVFRSIGGALQPESAWHFDLSWTAPQTHTTRAVAWADFDSDGDLDLAVGHYGASDVVWENAGGTFAPAPAWTAINPYSKTTSLAWGDWDNDGFPDLAAGHDGEPDAVYANPWSVDRSPPLWQSAEGYRTTGVAWGDRDLDGDLDLAISQNGDGVSGFYENTLFTPAHLDASWAEATMLPGSAPYVYVERPGETLDSYLYSSAERLGWPLTQPTVTVRYRLHDPFGSPVAATVFEYSLNGGGAWHIATPALGSPTPIGQALRNGQAGAFIWDAAADVALSDDARFRVTVMRADRVGPVQRARSSAVSPPFRIHALQCVWTSDVSVAASPLQPAPGDVVTLRAVVGAPGGPGTLRYFWDLGDGAAATGSVITHTYRANGTFLVDLRVEEHPACPVARPAHARLQLVVGTGYPDLLTYLPLVLKGSHGAASAIVSTSPNRPTEVQAGAIAGWEEIGPRSDVRHDASAPLEDLRVEGGAAAAMSTATSLSPDDDAIRVTVYRLGVESHPSVSGDGSRIAFWTTGRLTGRNDDGNIEIFLAEILSDGTVQYTQITSSTGSILAGFNLGPTIDDSGKRVAFFSDRDLVGMNPDHGFEVFLAEVDHTVELTQVTCSGRGFSVLPDLSGDGQFIAFVQDNDIYRAEVVRGSDLMSDWAITTTRVTTVTGEYGYNDQPSISQHGDLIAFVSDQDLVAGQNTDGSREIFVARIGSAGEIEYTQITDSDGGISELPSITGDGSRIAFVSSSDLTGHNPLGVRQVFLAEYISSTQEYEISQVTLGTEDIDQPSMSSDGNRVAYVSVDSGLLHLWDIIEQEDKAEDSKGGNAYPAISANGTDIVFVSNWDVYRRSYPLADLSVAKSAFTNTVASGDRLTYTISVTNHGPSAVMDAYLVDVLPRGLRPSLSVDVPDYTDDDGTPTGFGGGTDHGTGVRWDSGSSVLELTASANPFALPDAPRGLDAWTDMTGNVVLLHMDSLVTEGTDQVTPDTSGLSSRFACDMASGQCPIPSPGHMGPGLLFGGNHYLTSGSEGHLENLGPATWSMWLLRNEAAAGTLVAKTDGPARAWWIDFRSPTELGFVGTSWGFGVRRYTQDLPAFGEWFHLAVSWDGSSNPSGARIYINGEEVGYSLSGQVYVNHISPGDFMIGYASDSSWWLGPTSAYYRGFIDELAVFDRVLTGEEIRWHYSRQAPLRSGYFVSRAMPETTGTGAWSTISWVPQQVIGRELPDYSAGETGYPAGTLTMTGNVALWHLNEPAGVGAFLDSSGVGNDGYCSGARCPATGVGGWLKRHVRFDGIDDEIMVRPLRNVPNDELTVMLWMRASTANQRASLLTYGTPVQPTELALYYDSSSHFSSQGVGVCIGGTCRQAYVYVGSSTWRHITVTRRSSDGQTVIYLDGVPVYGGIIRPGYTIGSGGSLVLGRLAYWIPGWLGSPTFDGDLDEVALFDRVLGPDEVYSAYSRALSRASFQVRTCDGTVCTPFVGPDATGATAFTDMDNPVLTPPVFGLNVPNGPQLQYRLFMDSYGGGSAEAPRVRQVEVESRLQCVGSGTITCTLSTASAPLQPGSPLHLSIPVTVTREAYVGATSIGGVRTMTNTASVHGRESDHWPDDNVASVSTALRPVAVAGVQIAADSTGLLDEPVTFAATVTPGGASPPFTYTWSATDLAVTEYTSDEITSTATFSWTLAGTQMITVVVVNEVGIATDTHQIGIDNPLPVVTAVAPNSQPVYGAGLTLVVTGSQFADGAVVRYGGEDRPTTFVGRHTLAATIGASDLVTPGTRAVSVYNPAPGGGVSTDTVTFTVANRIPVLTSIEPETVTVGSADVSLTVGGDWFTAGGNGSIVRVDGQPLDTTFVSRNQLTVTIPAANLDAAGLITVSVYNPAPGGGVSGVLTFAVENYPPEIDHLTPSSALAGGQPVSVTVSGGGFSDGPYGSVVQWNGADQTTDYRNRNRLEFTLGTADLMYGGVYSVTVFNPSPGGGASNVVTFTVNNPVPTISELSHVTVPAGSADVTLVVTGTSFALGEGHAVLRWSEDELDTTVSSRTRLTATIPASQLAAAGLYTLTVRNPGPGGGVSNQLFITVENRVPAITSVSADSATAGDPTFTLVVTGTGFATGSDHAALRWNGEDRDTTVSSQTGLAATILASDLIEAGIYTVTIRNPQPGGGVSDPVTFTVNNRAPSISALSRVTAPVGSPGFTLVVTGTDFAMGTHSAALYWNGEGKATTVNSHTRLTADILPSDLTEAGVYTVTVRNPEPGGGVSNQLFVTVENGAPAITSMSADSATAGDPAFTLVVTGTGFATGPNHAVVRWSGQDRTTTVTSESRLTAQIPVTDLVVGAVYAVSVYNPPPGGGLSDPRPFTVTNPIPTITSIAPATTTVNGPSFTLTVDGVGFIMSSQVWFGGVPKATSYIQSSRLRATIPTDDITGTGTVTVTVMSPTPGGGRSNEKVFTVVP
ncbi:MAG: DUF11 domain-containing protein [Chloroflexi bacterium]|nr:DUF11 domain-containing protein [Chloroflexota bacterium]